MHTEREQHSTHLQKADTRRLDTFIHTTQEVSTRTPAAPDRTVTICNSHQAQGGHKGAHKGDPSQPLASIGRTGSRGLWRVGHCTSRSASACWEHGGKMARSHMDPDHIIMRPQHFGPLLTYLLLSSHKTGAVFEQTLLGVVKADDRLLELRCGRVDVRDMSSTHPSTRHLGPVADRPRSLRNL